MISEIKCLLNFANTFLFLVLCLRTWRLHKAFLMVRPHTKEAQFSLCSSPAESSHSYKGRFLKYWAWLHFRCGPILYNTLWWKVIWNLYIGDLAIRKDLTPVRCHLPIKGINSLICMPLWVWSVIQRGKRYLVRMKSLGPFFIYL